MRVWCTDTWLSFFSHLDSLRSESIIISWKIQFMQGCQQSKGTFYFLLYKLRKVKYTMLIDCSSSSKDFCIDCSPPPSPHLHKSNSITCVVFQAFPQKLNFWRNTLRYYWLRSTKLHELLHLYIIYVCKVNNPTLNNYVKNLFSKIPLITKSFLSTPGFEDPL